MEENTRHIVPVNDDTFEVVRSVRDVPPSHYIMKIESFSLLSQLLQKSGVDKYESNDFEAEGYKWRLLLYPDGNKKGDVTGHISLYLAMPDAKNLSLGSVVNVIFKFFVLDQIREKYLTLEEGRVRQFHALKTERGISRLLSLSTFSDPSNGYLIDDCCIFGAEVFVVKSEVKGESLTMINEPANANTIWKIDNFSVLKDESHISELFDAGGYQWKLELFPFGNSLKVKGKSLSLFLHIHNFSVLHPGTKLYVECKLIIKDQVHDKNYEKTVKRWYCSSGLNWGYLDFISLADIKDQKKGFIVNDTLILEAKITFISVVKCFA